MILFAWWECCADLTAVAQQPSAETSADDEAAQTPATGSVVGRVQFTGEPVPPRKIQITKDVDHCANAGGEFQEVVVAADGGLLNAVVEIQTKQAFAADTPPKDYTLRQKGCRFEPWLLVVPNGATVAVFNDDEVTHNVNTGLWNEMQAAGARPVSKPISGRQPIRVSCNIHSWMEAWIYPARSPLYAVSKANGHFEIKNVPVGKHRAMAWHPTLGRQRLRFEVQENEATEVEIAFAAK